MDWKLIALGCVGGAVPDVIRIIQNRYNLELPKYLWSPNFWLGFVLLVLLGGAASYLGGATDYKTALSFGFAAPEVISRLLSSGRPGEMGFTGTANSLRRFWSY